MPSKRVSTKEIDAINRNMVDAIRDMLGMGPLYEGEPYKSDEERFYAYPSKLPTNPLIVV